MRTSVMRINPTTPGDPMRVAEHKPLAQRLLPLIGILNDEEQYDAYDELDKLDDELNSSDLQYLTDCCGVTNEAALRALRRKRNDKRREETTTTLRPVTRGDVLTQGGDGTTIESDCSVPDVGTLGSLDEAIQPDRASRVFTAFIKTIIFAQVVW